MEDNSRINSEIKVINVLISILLVITVVVSVIALVVIPNYSKIVDLFSPLKPVDPDKDFITVFNVGEADSILICSNAQTVLIDTGTQETDNELCAKIRNLGIKKLDAVIISHLHSDHAGGISRVIENFEVSNLIVPDLDSGEEAAFLVRKAKNDVLNNGGKVYTAVTGMVTHCGRFEITVLGYYGAMSDENNRSVFLMAKHNDTKFLFTGDAEEGAEKQLIKDGINFDCDILKVGHHGSDSSSSEEFLQIATPKYAVISCGTDNQYSHPNMQVLERLSNIGAQILRTDLNGDITFHFYSDEVNVSSERLVENE